MLKERFGGKLRNKILLLGIIPMICFTLLNTLYILPGIEASIYDQKEQQVKDMVDLGLSILQHYEAQAKSGVLTTEEAKQRALDTIAAMRYGDEALDYFWINDFQPKMIMHPFRPELNGTDVSNEVDPNGTAIFVEFAKVAKAQGAGYVPYEWQYYGEGGRIEPKLSYVSSFQPWGWIIGTGIYTNDVDDLVASKTQLVLTVTGVLLAISVLGIVFFSKEMVKYLKQIVDRMATLAKGDLTTTLPVKTKDEIGVLSNGVNETIQGLRGMVKEIQKAADTLKGTGAHISTAMEESNLVLEQMGHVVMDISQGTQDSASAIEEIVSSVDELAHRSQEVVGVVKQGEQHIRRVHQLTQEGRSTVLEIVETMERLAEDSQEVGAIMVQLSDGSQKIEQAITLIKNIAAQTNLLALNAAIEAARAGEQGKGFAVVAEEVRKLAEESNKASNQVDQVIKNIQQQIRGAVEKVNDTEAMVLMGVHKTNLTESSIGQVVSEVDQLTSEMEEIAQAAEKQALITSEILMAIEGIGRNLEEAATGTEEMSASFQEQVGTLQEVGMASQQLSTMAVTLNQMLQRLRTE